MSTNTTPWSQLPVAISVNFTDLMALSHDNGDGSYTSVRATISDILSLIPTLANVRLGQFKRALATINASYPIEIAASLSADPGDTNNIAWTSDPFVFVSGPLYNYVQTYLGYTTSQMNVLMALAFTQPG